jgi:hypothetical protein
LITDLHGWVQFLRDQHPDWFVDVDITWNAKKLCKALEEIYETHPDLGWPSDTAVDEPAFDKDDDCAVVGCTFKFFDASAVGRVAAHDLLNAVEVDRDAFRGSANGRYVRVKFADFEHVWVKDRAENYK